MNEWAALDKSYHKLLDDLAQTISKNPEPKVAAKKAVSCVANWLNSPYVDLILPEQMQQSTHATAALLRLGEPLDD
jgi:hypothetical protein